MIVRCQIVTQSRCISYGSPGGMRLAEISGRSGARGSASDLPGNGDARCPAQEPESGPSTAIADCGSIVARSVHVEL